MKGRLVALGGLAIGLVVGTTTACFGDCPDPAPEPGSYDVVGLDDDRILDATMTVSRTEVTINYETADGSFTVVYGINNSG